MFFVSLARERKALLNALNATNVRSYACDPRDSPGAVTYCPLNGALYVAQERRCIFSYSPKMSQAIAKSFTAENINALACSPDGFWIVGGGGEQGCVYVWNSCTGELVRLIRGHIKPVRRVAFSADGTLFATASDDSTCRVWRAAQATSLYGTTEVFSSVANEGGASVAPALTITFHTLSVQDCQFFSAGPMLATCSLDHTVRVTDALSGAPLLFMDATSPLTALRILPADCGLVVGGADGSLFSVRFDLTRDGLLGGEASLSAVLSGARSPRDAKMSMKSTPPFEGGHKSAILQIALTPAKEGGALCDLSTYTLLAADASGSLLEWRLPAAPGSDSALQLSRQVLVAKHGFLSMCMVPRDPDAMQTLRLSRVPPLSRHPMDAVSGTFKLPPDVPGSVALNAQPVAEKLPAATRGGKKRGRAFQKEKVEREKAEKEREKILQDLKSELEKTMSKVSEMEDLAKKMERKLQKNKKVKLT